MHKIQKIQTLGFFNLVVICPMRVIWSTKTKISDENFSARLTCFQYDAEYVASCGIVERPCSVD
jgi:hypothetical protein